MNTKRNIHLAIYSIKTVFNIILNVLTVLSQDSRPLPIIITLDYFDFRTNLSSINDFDPHFNKIVRVIIFEWVHQNPNNLLLFFITIPLINGKFSHKMLPIKSGNVNPIIVASWLFLYLNLTLTLKKNYNFIIFVSLIMAALSQYSVFFVQTHLIYVHLHNHLIFLSKISQLEFQITMNLYRFMRLLPP